MPDHTFIRSGFADEIGPDLDTQLDVMGRLGIAHFDLRSIDGTSIVNYSPSKVEEIQQTLDERDVAVTSIGSSIGKVKITEEFERHFAQFERAVERAVQFDAPYIRLFSYYVPEDESPEEYREEVVRRMRAKVEVAKEAGVVLVLENETGLYGDTPQRCRDLLTAIDSPHLRMAFDPANFLEVGVDPYPDALVQLVEYVEQLHIKDASKGTSDDVRPAGQGNSRFPEILDMLSKRGFRGPASLEPHLSDSQEYDDLDGADQYEVAASALRTCLEEVGANYE